MSLAATDRNNISGSDARSSSTHSDLDLGRFDKMARQFRDHDLFMRIYVLMAALSCGVGAVILTGGASRFSGPGFRGPRDLVAWLPFFDAWVYWGALFALHGIALALSMKRSIAVHTLRFGMVVYVFLAITFVVSVFKEPTAAAVGSVAYFVFAILALFMSDHLERFGWEG